MPPLLLNQPPAPEERAHQVRFGLGAGVEPQLHAAFEERFGFPLVEVWGMTETGRIFADRDEPRQIHTRAFGRPHGGFEARVVDDADREVPRGPRASCSCAGAAPRGRATASSPATSRTPRPPRRRGAAAGSTPATWFARRRRHAGVRRPQEEHHPPLRREHRRRRGGGGAAGARGGGPGGGAGGARRGARGGGHGLRRADAGRDGRTRRWRSG